MSFSAQLQIFLLTAALGGAVVLARWVQQAMAMSLNLARVTARHGADRS